MDHDTLQNIKKCINIFMEELEEKLIRIEDGKYYDTDIEDLSDFARYIEQKKMNDFIITNKSNSDTYVELEHPSNISINYTLADKFLPIANDDINKLTLTQKIENENNDDANVDVEVDVDFDDDEEIDIQFEEDKEGYIIKSICDDTYIFSIDDETKIKMSNSLDELENIINSKYITISSY